MGCVHVVMIWGTNNATTQGLSAVNIHHRSIGSRLVLASRIFYALFIWTAKYTVSEFLKRVIGSHWRRSYEIGLKVIRIFLAVTFVLVLIATLAECHPFTHYWQVVPDPGPKCREGLAQLIAMGVCDIVTDVFLVIYPIPIVLASSMPVKRKISLTLLFTLSLGLVAITGYRIPAVINRDGAQQFRTLLASLEILAAAGVSNAIVIGSFIRDRGVKKAKYKFGSTGGSSLDRAPTRRTTTTLTIHHWGSDADLVSDVGLSLNPELRSRTNSVPRPAPVAMPNSHHRSPAVRNSWNFPHDRSSTSETDSTTSDPKYTLGDEPVSPGAQPGDFTHPGAGSLPRKMSFFDVGGLLDSNSPVASSQRTSLSHGTVVTQDFASNPPSSANSTTPLQPQPQQFTNSRMSRTFHSDTTGSLSAHKEESPESSGLELAPSRSTPSPTSNRNSSRRSQAYPGVTTRFTPTRSVHDVEEGDGHSLGQSSVSRGTSSLIAALGTSPPAEQHEANKRDHSTNGAPPNEELELMDAGGLLR
ncbi:putative integral membrane [Phaeomoniella chlamydospora]|uniref:Putative integral membrane n=1 Tax=Phaeomoniella chlamydospora TaxID=158046 RepID=A0A0G2GLI8_PHACM|nr:putative integral membrane [Phaeomoniella chlamydospora]